MVQSFLPSVLEAKRLQIGKIYFKLTMLVTLTWITLFSLSIVLIAKILPASSWFNAILLALLFSGLGNSYAHHRISKYISRPCVQLGYICPRCSKPLYKPFLPKNRIYECPECGKVLVNYE